MIARACLAVCLCIAASAAAQDAGELATRTNALRASLVQADDAADRSVMLRRQLLTSMERRQDLVRSRTDAQALLATPAPLPPIPDGVIERDDLRRQIQEMDASLQGELRRITLLNEERTAAAARLVDRVAAHRGLVDAGAAGTPALENARLDMQLAESAVAELDLLFTVLKLQRDATVRRRDELASQLARAPRARESTLDARDEAVILARMERARRVLATRLAAAVDAREQARAALDDAGDAQGLRREWLAERLANADIELDLTREAMSNLALEDAAWRLALRFQRTQSADALIEAREQGPRLLQRLKRRADFLEASSAQILERIGALDARASDSSAADAATRQALRDVLEQRLRVIQAALLDERRVAQLIERLRDDLEARMGEATWKDKAALGAATVREWAVRAWNFELFTVNQSVNVEGRTTTVARGVTVGKLIKAPLLLLIGLFLSFRVVVWREKRARRRGVDEARARLVRRWTLGVLACGWALASLALAGIPLAAFAFAGGAIAIGIGFGTQNLFKNLISGILVLLERPFRLGDVIEVGALRGTVVDIDLRTSVVRDNEGAETLIPNSTLVEQNVRNLTFRSRTTRQSLLLQVDVDSDPRVVMDAMRSAAERHGQLLETPAPSVQLSDVSLHGLSFVLSYWLDLKAGVEGQRIASDLRLMVLNAFVDAGIRVARATADVPRPVSDAGAERAE